MVRSIARIDGALVLNAIQTFLQHILVQLPASMSVQEAGGDLLARLEACLLLFFSVGEFYKVSVVLFASFMRAHPIHAYSRLNISLIFCIRYSNASRYKS